MPNSQLWRFCLTMKGNVHLGGWSESSLSSAVCRLSSHWLESKKKVKMLSHVRLWLIGGEVIGWCSRNLQHNLKLTILYLGRGPYYLCCVLCLVAQSCLILCRPHGLQPSRLLCPWDSLGKNTGVGCYALLQGIFSTQGSNPVLPHCRRILYRLSQQGGRMGA